MMGIVGTVVTLPILGGPRLVRFVAEVVAGEAQRQLLDEDDIRGKILELQERLEAGEIGEEEYEQLEAVLVERLDAARALSSQRDE